MSWNYRVIQKEYLLPRELQTVQGETETIFEIHEVYYDKDGNITMYSAEPISPQGVDELNDLKSDIEMMKEAFDKPVLLESDLIKMFKGK